MSSEFHESPSRRARLKRKSVEPDPTGQGHTGLTSYMAESLDWGESQSQEPSVCDSEEVDGASTWLGSTYGISREPSKELPPSSVGDPGV